MGDRGAALSGGQKQRIGKVQYLVSLSPYTIVQPLLEHLFEILKFCFWMKVCFSFYILYSCESLLVFVATSAMDNQNEKIIQEALDQSAKGTSLLKRYSHSTKDCRDRSYNTDNCSSSVDYSEC